MNDSATQDPPKELPPPGKADASTLKKWVEDGLYYNHLIRIENVSNDRRAELYDRGAQWLQKAQAGYDTGVGRASASQWASLYWDPNDPDYIATPVFNEGLPARMNESARIGRPDYRPTASAKGDNPNIQDRMGAKKLQDMIRHRIREMGWDVEKELVYYHMPVYGGAWIRSEWETKWDDTTMVPVKGAAKCPGDGCGFTLASKAVPLQLAGQVTALGDNVAEAQGQGQNALDVAACPTCKAPMLPYQPTMQEAFTAKDAVGRPLGEEVPKGNWRLSLGSPYDVFPRNLGLDMRPGNIDEVAHAHVEHLDWAAERWPEKAGQLRPESPANLAKYHPIAGAPEVYLSVLENKTFDSALRIKERIKRPWMQRQTSPDGQVTFKRNQGRHVVMGGDVALLDAPLLMPSLTRPGEFVERVYYEYIPWEIKDGGRCLDGMGLWDMIFDPQDTANTIWSQAAAIRERLAVPVYLAARTHNFEVKALKGGVPGRIAEIDIDVTAPAMVPQLINNATIADGVWGEQDRITAAIHDRYTGNARIEGGTTPPGVDAAQAIRALKEAAGEKREPRIRRIRTGMTRVYEHGAKLMQGLYIEKRPCKYEDEDGEERWTSMTGQELGKDVEIAVEPEEVDTDEKRQQVKDLMGSGVINLADPATTKVQRRRVAKYLNAPDDLYEDEDLQEKSAQREWIRFKQENRVPVVDPSLDDHEEHYQEHGRRAHSEWFRDLEDRADWDGALNVLAPTWDQTLEAIKTKALQPVIPPPPPPDGVNPAAMPQMPPAPPVSLQMQLLQAWQHQLEQAGFLSPPAPPQPGVPDPKFEDKIKAMGILMPWRAHMESHRLEAEIKQMRAQMQPTLAAPGADSTAQGTQPTAGAPPEQGASPAATAMVASQGVH